MNAFLVVGLLAVCTLIFAMVVATFVALGVPVLLALLLVYLSVIVWMRGMQRRAGCALDQHERRRFTDQTSDAASSASSDVTRDGEARAGLGDLLHQP